MFGFFCTYLSYYYYQTCGKQCVKQQVELVDPSFIVFDSGTGPLEFLPTILPLTPHEIGIGQKNTFITNTLHASDVFTTPITTFEETPYKRKIFIMLKGLQILSQVEHGEETNVEPIKETVTQPIAKD